MILLGLNGGQVTAAPPKKQKGGKCENSQNITVQSGFKPQSSVNVLACLLTVSYPKLLSILALHLVCTTSATTSVAETQLLARFKPFY